MILLGYASMSKLYLEECCRKVIGNVSQNEGIPCSISSGQEKGSEEEIYLSYQEALQALRCHISQNGYNIFRYTGEDMGDSSEFMEIHEEERMLIKDIQKYNADSLKDHIHAIFEKALVGQEPYERVNSTCVRLATGVFSVLDEMGLKIHNKTYTYIDTLTAIRQYHSLNNLREFMQKFMESVSDCLENAEKRKYGSVVECAVNYVEENFQHEISVKSISAELYITPNYFSQIFKSQMGMNFIDYLNEVRVEHAKKLLKNNQLKVYEVAEQ